MLGQVLSIDVPSEVFALFVAVVMLFATTGVGLVAWGLKQVVSLAQVVARLEERVEDLEGR